jgi:hypothetical protein
MKYTNVIVSILIVAAVLVAAYAIGLLVRQARMEDVQPQASVVEHTDTADTEAKMGIERQLPGARPAQPLESPAQLKDKREQTVKAMSNRTEEEKRQLTTKQVRSRFSAAGKGRNRNLSPGEREKVMQKWQSLSEEEKQAIREQEARRSREQQDSLSDVPQPESTTAAQDESEPNQPDQG